MTDIIGEIHRIALTLENDTSGVAHRELDAAVATAKEAHHLIVSQAIALKPALEEALKAIEPEAKAVAIKLIEDFITAAIHSLGAPA
jgi:hypothetical protein